MPSIEPRTHIVQVYPMQRIIRLLDQFYISNLQTDFGWFRPISDGTSLIRLDWNQRCWEEPDRPDYVSREQLVLASIGSMLCLKFHMPLPSLTQNSPPWLASPARRALPELLVPKIQFL